MLLPSIVVESTSVRVRADRGHAPHAAHAAGQAAGVAAPVAALLVGWLLLGAAVLACVPSARGGTAFGATGSFWLVGAPLIDLAWLLRRRWVPLLRMAVRRACAGVARGRACRRMASRRLPRVATARA